MKLKWIALIIVGISATVQAQQQKSAARLPKQSVEQTVEQQAVTNDDRGRAFIIVREAPLLAPNDSQRAVVSEPQQCSVFLGNGWARATMRAREPELANLLANISDQAQVNALNERGVKNLFGATSSQEKFDDSAEHRNISDLEIQSILAGMLKEGSLPRPNAKMIYVVFLDSRLHSTLGSMIAGKHYLAYHNFFNTSNAQVHYLVVPFVSDQRTAYQISLSAFLAAALNPTRASQY
jgi:hypothetical protein